MKTPIADFIMILFLIVTIPHTARMLEQYDTPAWWWLAWCLASAIDIGIAYGGFLSSSSNQDKEARMWATWLFYGLSLGSYCLNTAHFVKFGGGLYSIGLGAFFPIGILLLAKIKGRLSTAPTVEKVQEVVKPVEVTQPTFAADSGGDVPDIQSLLKQTVPLATQDEIREAYKAGQIDTNRALELGIAKGTVTMWEKRYRRE